MNESRLFKQTKLISKQKTKMKKNYLQILPAIFRDIEAELIFQRLTPSHGEKAEEKETGINKK